MRRGAFLLLAAALTGPVLTGPALAQATPPTAPATAPNPADDTTPAGNAAAGRRIASGICQSCHGMDGLAKLPEMPTIAGADATYLQRQLAAYQSGERKNEMMNAVAPMLDERKMSDVAAYYASVVVTAQPP